MRIAILHGIIQQYWAVYKDQTEISVNVTMALEETQDITDIQDIINILTQVLRLLSGVVLFGLCESVVTSLSIILSNCSNNFKSIIFIEDEIEGTYVMLILGS